MRLKLAGLLVFVVLASGCAQSLPEDASEGFAQLSEKIEGQNFHVEYEVSISRPGSSMPPEDFKIDFYSFDGVQKAVGSPVSSIASARAVYMVGNRSIECTEAGGSVSCNKDGDPGLFKLVTNPSFDGFNYSGSGEYVGRGCKMFEASPDMPSIEPPSGTSLDTEICVDRGLGYPSFMQFNITESSQEASISVEALSFDRDVSESNVEIPETLSVSASCYTEPSVSVTPLKDVDSVELSVNGGEARTVELGNRFEEKEVDVSGEVSEGSNDFEVSTGDFSASDRCYFSNFSFDEPSYDPPSYPGAEESSLDLSQFESMDRFENGGFSDAEMAGDQEVDIDGWSHTDGSTGHLRTWEEGITGQSIGTGWKQNGYGDEASISQEVDLSGVEAVGLDVEGTGGNPRRSKIVLEVDGEEQGFFIKRPQQETTYRDLGVELSEDYSGDHNVTVRWVQIQGDNLGNSMIDNVKAYR